MALYTVTEAAPIAQRDRSRIRQALAAGEIRAVKVEGLWLIESDSLQEWIDTPRKPGRPVGWRKRKNDERPKHRKRRKQERTETND